MKNGTIFEVRNTEITLEELKELDSFKDYTEEQAAALIRTMKIFARIIYNIWTKEEQKANNSKQIEITIADPIKKAA